MPSIRSSSQPRVLSALLERRVVLRTGEPFDRRSHREPGRHQTVGRRRAGHQRVEPLRPVASEADTIGPDHLDGMLEVVDRPLDRAPLRVDRDRVQHQAEDAVTVGQRTQLLVGEVARGLVDGAAAGMRDADAAGVGLQALVEEPRRGVREVEDHAQLREARQQPPPEPGEAAVVGGAVRERVAPVPGQPGHPQAELPEEVGCRDLVPERLDPLEGEHQPDPLAALDRVEVRLRPHREDALGVLAHRVLESGHLAERLAQAPLGLELELDEDRADLQADVAGLEQRQPRLCEDVRLAEPVLAVCELQQQVGVSIGEQALDYPLNDDRRRVHQHVRRHESRHRRGDQRRCRGTASRRRAARSPRPSARSRRGVRAPPRSER